MMIAFFVRRRINIIECAGVCFTTLAFHDHQWGLGLATAVVAGVVSVVAERLAGASR